MLCGIKNFIIVILYDIKKFVLLKYFKFFKYNNFNFKN